MGVGSMICNVVVLITLVLPAWSAAVMFAWYVPKSNGPTISIENSPFASVVPVVTLPDIVIVMILNGSAVPAKVILLEALTAQLIVVPEMGEDTTGDAGAMVSGTIHETVPVTISGYP